jgi:MgsA-like AAA+ ATPase family protein/SWIM zinc finger
VPSRKPEWSYSHERPDQVRSALQKAIRRGETDDALHWLVEMILSGQEWWAWRTLLVITSEDVGPAWPEGPAVIGALYSNWRTTSEWLMAVHATVLLCRAPKSRLVDDALAAHLLGHTKEMARPIPDEALDLHTGAGKYGLGRTEDSPRGQKHWWDEAGRIENEQPDPNADHYKALVKQWWAENRQYPEAWKPGDDHKPKEAQGAPYQLPLGVERIGQIAKVPGNRQGDIWTVDLDKGECDCPAFGRYPGPCKHVVAVKAMVKTEGGSCG